MFCNRSCGAVATISLCCRYKKGSLLRCTAEMPESGASQWEKTLRPPFSPHADICVGPRLYPDTINPAFHLFLALKMSPQGERTAPSPVNAMCELRHEAKGFLYFLLPAKSFPFIHHRSPLLSLSCPWDRDSRRGINPEKTRCRER